MDSKYVGCSKQLILENIIQKPKIYKDSNIRNGDSFWCDVDEEGGDQLVSCDYADGEEVDNSLNGSETSSRRFLKARSSRNSKEISSRKIKDCDGASNSKKEAQWDVL